jgi:pimeloyl-ACP methyl ester carboxylesterase
MDPIEVATAAGPVWFWGEDTGRPILLVITGTYAEKDLLHRTQLYFDDVDVLRAHLPGNHCPPARDNSIATFAEAFSEALQSRFAERPVVVVGLSVGALVALGLSAANVRRLVLVEPPLRTEGAWPIVGFRDSAPPEAADFLWEVFGVAKDRIEPRDYTGLLDRLPAPAHAVLGDLPLQPERPLEILPSLVDEASRARLMAHPDIEVSVAKGAGHNIPRDAPALLLEVMKRACALAFDESAFGQSRPA